jgi:hypothetical protein
MVKNTTPSRVVAEVKIDAKEPVIEKPASVKKKEFAEVIARYKEQNPVKYEAKKAVLEERLNSIK